MEFINFSIPRYKDLPKVPLYKDQVICYLEDLAKSLKIESNEKLLTPTMLNSYVKQKVIPAPKDKKYNQEHLAYLIVVCILKQVFSLQEICGLINIQIKSCSIERAYDCFCDEIEKVIKAIFLTRDFSYLSIINDDIEESKVLKSAILSFAHKLYITEYLKGETIN